MKAKILIGLLALGLTIGFGGITLLDAEARNHRVPPPVRVNPVEEGKEYISGRDPRFGWCAVVNGVDYLLCPVTTVDDAMDLGGCAEATVETEATILPRLCQEFVAMYEVCGESLDTCKWSPYSLPYTLTPDLNGDGVVNASDFIILAGNWGSRYSATDFTCLSGWWGFPVPSNPVAPPLECD